MSYIAPNSTVWILAGVPLDPEYVNTTYYDTLAQQEADFVQYRKFVLNDYSYQRADRGYLRVDTGSNHVADDLYNCNYMMFKNTSFGTKWFYAFIRSVEYVNNRTALIRYEIDVMQTWMFNYGLPMSFVVREHSATDRIGDNTVPEDISVGETFKVNVFNVNFKYNDDVYALVYYNRDSEINLPQDGSIGSLHTKHLTLNQIGELFNYIYSGVKIIQVDGNLSSQSGRTDFINSMRYAIDNCISQSANIVKIVEFPRYVNISGTGLDPSALGDFEIYNENMFVGWNRKVITHIRPSAFVLGSKTYTPKNNKLLTSPFVLFELTNKEGNVKQYNLNKFINFNLNVLNTVFCFLPMPNQDSFIAPINYSGQDALHEGTMIGVDPNTFVNGSGLNEVSWSEDSYLSWKAQNLNSLMVNNITTALISLGTFGVGAMYGNPAVQVAGALGYVHTLVDTASSYLKAQDAPDVMRGDVGSGTPLTAMNLKGYNGYFIVPRPEQAEIIDNYFTMYGYALNMLKTPNCRTANRRPYWNYTKLSNSAIIPIDNDGVAMGLPNDDIAIINRVFNSGVREWNALGNISKYNLNNEPVTP